MEGQVSTSFFCRDTRDVALDLLGAVLVSTAGGGLTAGRIVETEAYLGSHDAGSHAATKGMTVRNAIMYGPPGIVYVYFTYGMHHMVNLVCEEEGVAGAVLIRALEPLHGIDVMRERRKGRSRSELTDGPGKLTQALGIDLAANETTLGEGPLAVYDASGPQGSVGSSGRIGLSCGHELEYRYFLLGNRFVSKARPRESTHRERARQGERTGEP